MIADQYSGALNILKYTPNSDGTYAGSVYLTLASFQPGGIAVDGKGNLFVIDYSGEEVFKEDLADPPTLSFAATDAGSTSADSPQTETVENIGNAVLNLTGLSYPMDFPERPGGGTNACTSTTSLNPAGMCNLNIDFTPRFGNGQHGYFEDLTLTDNALNVAGAQQSVQLGGVSPELNVTANAFSALLGVVFSGPVATFTDGTDLAATSTFAASIYWGDGNDSTAAITQPGGAGTPYVVTGSHLYVDTGSYMTNITVSKGQNAASGSNIASVTGSPGPATQFLLGAPATTSVDSPFTLTVTALDSSGNTVTIYNGSVAFTSSDPLFVNPGTLTLSGGVGHTTVILKTVGSQTITATDSANHLSGTSSAITVASASSALQPVNFGSQPIGTPSAAQSLTFSFSSGTPVGSIQVVTQGATGLDFTNAGTGTCTAGNTHSAGASCTVDVTFGPKLPGTRYGAAELLDSSGTVLATAYLQGTGVGPMANFLPGIQSTIIGGLNGPTAIAVDASGNLYITAGGQVLKETLSGGSYTQSTIYSGQSSLIGVAVDGSGCVYFVDNAAFKVYKETPSAGGYSLTEIASGLNFPLGVAVDGDGNVYIANAGSSQVLKETPLPTGGYTQSVAISDETYNIWGIAVDGQNNLYLSASDSFTRPGTTESLVLKETPSGGSYTESVIAAIGGVNFTYGLAVDASGNVYIALNGGVAKFTPISNSYIQSSLVITASANAVAVDGSGKVYAFNGGSISKLELADPPSLAFATTAADQTSTDSPQTVTLENAGNTELTVAGLSYPIDFPQAAAPSNACTNRTSLGAGQGCNLAIDFTPLTVGSLNEVVTLTDNTLNVNGSQQEIAVSGTGVGVVGEATHFVLTTTGSVVAGSPFTLTVTGLDYLGNTATLYSGSVAFSSSDPLFVIPAPVALTGGVGQTTVTLKTSGARTITATDTTNSALNGTGSFTLVPAAAVSFVVTVPVAATIDRLVPITVTAEDLYGNQATGYTGTVVFSSTDPSATLPGPSSLKAGAQTFQAIFRTQGQKLVTVTDSESHLSSTSAAIVVSQNAPNEWTWMGGNSTIGSNCTPDQLGLNCGRPGVYGMLGKPARGNAPGARTGAQSWTDGSGNLWLFGGAGFDGNGTYGTLNDLWELDASLDDWTWKGGSSTVPKEFGGWPGIYGNVGVAGAGNMPGSRTGASTWTDADGNLWLFGGSGVDATGAVGYLNDFWEFKDSLNQWVWMGGSSTIGSSGGQPGVYGALGTPAAGNMPGSRSGASSWTDTKGHLWLFGGASFSANESFYSTWYLNDLWEFFPELNEWAWMGGSSYDNPAIFITSDSCDPNGGCGWSGEYGSLGVPAAGNNPGSRSGAASWTDDRGHLWLFGGFGFDSNRNSSGPLNDLWEFDPATQEWTWISGSNSVLHELIGQPGVYGTLGSPSTANTPGGRSGASTWADRIGHFWLYGGSGSDSKGTGGDLNDLWVFDPSTDQWAWMSGSSTATCLPQNNGNCGQPGMYGMLGTPAAGNVPGGRSGASSWIDNSGNLWLFGGAGYDANGNANGVPDSLNDLWEYEPPIASPPTFSPAGGTYASPQTVTISDASPGATIYYTTNGTAPTTSATIYSGQPRPPDGKPSKQSPA